MKLNKIRNKNLILTHTVIFLLTSLLFTGACLAIKPVVKHSKYADLSAFGTVTDEDFFKSIENFDPDKKHDGIEELLTEQYFCKNQNKQEYKDRINQGRGITRLKIFTFVTEMIRVPCNGVGATFIRWETPVRYYLTGLEKYPELDKLFVDKMNEVAKITGLDIKRHKQQHFKYQKQKQLKIGLWPKDDVHTNTLVYFFDDVEVFKNDALTELIYSGFNTTPEQALRKGFKLLNNTGQGDNLKLSTTRYSHDYGKGNRFVFQVTNLKKSLNKLDIKKYFHSKQISVLVSRVAFNVYLSNLIPSLFNDNRVEPTAMYTKLDQAMLSALYNAQIHSGMSKYRASRIMTQYIAKKLKI